MIFYILATVVGVLFILAGVAVMVAFLFFAVYKRIPSEAPSLELAFSLYLVGHGLFLFRNFLITDIAHRVKEHGTCTTARILSAKQIGTPDVARDRYWYELEVELEPNAAEGRSDRITTSITQLFNHTAPLRLRSGERVQIKYSLKYRQGLVVDDYAFVSLRR